MSVREREGGRERQGDYERETDRDRVVCVLMYGGA